MTPKRFHLNLIFLPAFAFWLLTSLYHLKFSLFLVTPITTQWGTIKLKDYAPQAGYFLLGLFFIYLIWYFFSKRHRAIFYLWILWIIGIAFINLYLLATPLENIHFVQYGFLSILLLRAFQTPHFKDVGLKSQQVSSVLFWATFAGVIDEFMQYLWITFSYSHHIDFNDFLLNLMGSIAGILCYISFKPIVVHALSFTLWEFNFKELFKSWKVRFSLFSSLIFLLLYYFSISGISPYNQYAALLFERDPNLLGHWNKAFNGGEYYILAPLEGTLLILLTAFIFHCLILRSLIAISRDC